MTEQEAIEYLRNACQKAGGQRQFAELHGFSTGYISDVLAGKRALADRILIALGIERVVTYRKKRTNVATNVATGRENVTSDAS